MKHATHIFATVSLAGGLLAGAEALAQEANQVIDLDALREATTAPPPSQFPLIWPPSALPDENANPPSEATGSGTVAPGWVFPSEEELNRRLAVRLEARRSDTLAETCELIAILGITIDPTACQDAEAMRNGDRQ